MNAEDSRYRLWAQDASVLASIGRSVFPQPTSISVRIPRSFAEQAVAAWERPEDDEPLPAETTGQRAVRHNAGSLGLIGLSIQERGVWEGDEVIVPLDAWYIGDALTAADEAGLLEGLSPPNR